MQEISIPNSVKYVTELSVLNYVKNENNNTKVTDIVPKLKVLKIRSSRTALIPNLLSKLKI